MIFPTIVYRRPGMHSCPGGSFDYRSADNETQFKRLLGEGWSSTLPNANTVAKLEKSEPSIKSDSKTAAEEIKELSALRAALESRATELNIKFDKKSAKNNILIEQITKVLQDQIDLEKAAADKIANEKAAADKIANEKASADKMLADKVARDKAIAEQKESEEAAAIKASKEQMAKDHRKLLEAQATSLGIGFSKNISNEVLQQRINKALEAEEDL